MYIKAPIKSKNNHARFIINAVGLHRGGGGSLLTALLDGIPSDVKVIALIDSRMNLPHESIGNLRLLSIRPTIVSRLFAQCWLLSNVLPGDRVLCLGSLPPLFKLKGKCFVFIQNRYLIGSKSLAGFAFNSRLRIIFEKLRFKFAIAHSDEFIVQTPSMKGALLATNFLSNQSIYMRPFAGNSNCYQRSIPFNAKERSQIRYDFVYVASGEPHKNHSNLIAAWCLLSKENLYPSLCLTLDIQESRGLVEKMERDRLIYGLNIENIGILPHDKISMLYTQSKALIFPSKFESLGLPLIEARQAGISVVASELDFVRDVLDPEEAFDPESPISIARAVKRFLMVDEKPLHLLNGNQFMTSISVFDKGFS